MHTICVQVQPDLLRDFDPRSVEALHELEREESVLRSWSNSGDANGPYVNIQFETSALDSFWPILRAKIVSLGLQAACIVTRTGERGWDDYLIMHHFDHDVR